jgi:Ca-activated chloride channel family protein
MRRQLVTTCLILAGLPLVACGDDADGGWYGSADGGWYQNSNGNHGAIGPDPVTPSTVPDPVRPEVCLDATDVPVTLYMSADDSNSQAQPVYARRQLSLGQGAWLRGLAAREYEYLNYYGFDYAPAAPGELAVVPEMRYREDLGEYSLLVAVVAPRLEVAERRPWNLVFSADTSGSMSGTPLENSKHVMRAIAAQMREGDIVALVNWGDYQNVALAPHPVSGPSDPHVLDAIDGLASDGSTDLYSGLVTAYELAGQSYSPERLSRVILISDGGANTGITEDTLIGAQAAQAQGDGIFLVGVGTSDSYNHELMDHVTDLGKGAYLYVPDQAEAERVFGAERILANLEVAALDVQLAVTLPPQYVLSRFFGEEVSTVQSEVVEQHLSPNDQMLYHSMLVYCGEGDPEAETLTLRATWTDPGSHEPRSAELVVTAADLLVAPATHLEKAELLVDAARLIVNADALDATGWSAAGSDLLARIEAALAVTADADLVEIQGMVQASRY